MVCDNLEKESIEVGHPNSESAQIEIYFDALLAAEIAK
jgi:hypothetical protein